MQNILLCSGFLTETVVYPGNVLEFTSWMCWKMAKSALEYLVGTMPWFYPQIRRFALAWVLWALGQECWKWDYFDIGWLQCSCWKLHRCFSWELQEITWKSMKINENQRSICQIDEFVCWKEAKMTEYLFQEK